MLHAFIAGLIAVLTPAHVFMLYFLLFAFSHLRSEQKSKHWYILLFGAFVLILFPIYGIFILSNTGALSYHNSNFINLVSLICSLFFGVWLTGILKNISFNQEGHKIGIGLIILCFAVVFTMVSFTSSTAIIGGLILNAYNFNVSPDSNPFALSALIPNLVLLALGTLIPVLLLLLLFQKPIGKLRVKRGWELAGFLSGFIFIAITIYSQVIKLK